VGNEDINKLIPYDLMSSAVGTEIKVLSNDYEEYPLTDASPNTYQEIVFQIIDEEPDIGAIPILYTLSMLSFSDAKPRGFSDIDFDKDDDWEIGYFVHGLEFKFGKLKFSADYVAGRLMKTNISFEAGGKVKISTRNRGRSAERWLTNLQGKKHLKEVK
jgi:hypothetical protein